MTSPNAITPESFAVTQRAFTGHLRDPDRVPAPQDVPAERIAIYRDLVMRNVERMVGNLFPVLRTLTPEERWQALLRGFLSGHSCRNGLFSTIPWEFLRYLEEQGAGADDPPWMAELAHYECMEYAATIDPAGIDLADVDPDGDLVDGVPVLSPLARLLRYGHPVHTLNPASQPRDPTWEIRPRTAAPAAPPRQPTYIVVCRSRAEQVGFIELNPVSARLLELVRGNTGEPGRALLLRIAGELRHPSPQTVIDGGRDILERLRARDVVLGIRR